MTSGRNGGEIRNPLALEAAKLCRGGMTQVEAAKKLGVHPQTVSTWFGMYGAFHMVPDKGCTYCGQSMAGMSNISLRKYCSKTCASRMQRARKPFSECQRVRYDVSLRIRAMELYWDGLSSRVISGHMGIPRGTIDSWAHHAKGGKGTSPTRKIHGFGSIMGNHGDLGDPASEAAWTIILRPSARERKRSEATGRSVRLVSELVNSHADFACLSSHILDRLEEDPASGVRYAFCSHDRTHLITLQWQAGTFCLTRMPKAHGRYVWPDGKLGLTVEIPESAFERLLVYRIRAAHHVDLPSDKP